MRLVGARFHSGLKVPVPIGLGLIDEMARQRRAPIPLVEPRRDDDLVPGTEGLVALGVHDPLGRHDLAVLAGEGVLGSVRRAEHETPASADPVVHLADRELEDSEPVPAPHVLGLRHGLPHEPTGSRKGSRHDDLSIRSELYVGAFHDSFPFFGLHLDQQVVESIEPGVPDVPEALEPTIELPERCGTQSVEALLRARLDVHQPCVPKDAQVLRRLRLTDRDLRTDLGDRLRPSPKQVDDLKPLWLGQGRHGLDDHATYIPTRLYTCQVMFHLAGRARASSFAAFGSRPRRRATPSSAVVEVGRPNRQARRRHGKSDGADAAAAARAALNGDDLGAPKSQDGTVEVIRVLRLERRSAIRARTQAANQLHAVVATAPEPLRGSLRELTIGALVERVKRFRVAAPVDAVSGTQVVLRGLGRRWTQLDQEVRAIDVQLEQLVKRTAPDLVKLRGVGTEVASALLVAAGHNPDRLEREASFAALCGVSALDASSGRQNRHRLNRGGNRDANRALWVIALVRLRSDPRTRAYVARRIEEARTKPEILRCLKRYIAREVFKILRRTDSTTSSRRGLTRHRSINAVAESV